MQVMLTSTPSNLINKIYVHDHAPISTWQRDNLIIIGEAAHAPLPTSGQGACQALEDTWHLANCLQDNQHDVRTAFSQFNSTRYEKTSNITHAARTFASSLFNRSEGFCRVRNEKSRSTDFAQLVTAIAQGWAQNLPING